NSQGQNSQGQNSQGQNSQGQNNQGQSNQGQSENPGAPTTSTEDREGQPNGSKGKGESRGGSSQAGGGDLQGDTNLGTDEVDLEHARRATDMVLKRLREQQFDPDPELLKKMNWTKKDLAKFLQRWEKMKQKADEGSPAAKQNYQNALRSLGLTPGGQTRDLKVEKDKMFGLREDGAVNRPPAEFMDDFNAFLKSRNRKKER
ncbi:MAG: hypothetical protein MK106_00005, partial [Mariniblastus sp.]|nr:hypothetical protein [Mariniblastus sp.]